MSTLKEFFVTDVVGPNQDCSACPRLVDRERLKALNGHGEYALRQVFWVDCTEINRRFQCALLNSPCVVRQLTGNVDGIPVDVRVRNPQHIPKY